MKPQRGRHPESQQEDIERRHRRDDGDEMTRDTGGMSSPGRSVQPRGNRPARGGGPTRSRKKK